MWNLYNRIELLCADEGINITQMCKQAGVSRSIMSELKAGRTQLLSSETAAKIANYFGVSIAYFSNVPPFDFWEEINENRGGFFYYIPVPYETLKVIWGIDKDNPELARAKDIIRFLSLCVKSVRVDCDGDWDVELVDTYAQMWKKQILSDETLADNIIPLPKTKKIPLLGTIACGEPILATENIDKYIEMPESVGGTFALKCKGDSMINAHIFDGDVVYIREQPNVENGEIAAVLIGDEATLKRVYKYPSKVVLRPENPLYNDITYAEEEMNDVRILGKAVAHLSAVR